MSHRKLTKDSRYHVLEGIELPEESLVYSGDDFKHCVSKFGLTHTKLQLMRPPSYFPQLMYVSAVLLVSSDPEGSLW